MCIQDIMSLFSPSLYQDPKFIYKPPIWNHKIPELTGTVEAFGWRLKVIWCSETQPVYYLRGDKLKAIYTLSGLWILQGKGDLILVEPFCIRSGMGLKEPSESEELFIAVEDVGHMVVSIRSALE